MLDVYEALFISHLYLLLKPIFKKRVGLEEMENLLQPHYIIEIGTLQRISPGYKTL